jgi:hypothetical protein
MWQLDNRARAGCIALAGLIGFATLTFAAPTHAAELTPQVVYGRDNRSEVYLLRGTRARLAAATVALIWGDSELAGQEIDLEGPPLGEAFNLCRGQRYATQPSIAFCSGALVAPDVVLTAGHCIRAGAGQSGVPLDEILFVFGYQMINSRTARTRIRGQDVYAARSLIRRVEGGMNRPDYALIRLDREVVGRQPVALAPSNVLQKRLPIFTIGHPSGLPAKVANGARITRVLSRIFFSNLDAFGGNSGSPVFSASTNRLIGVLDEGQQDYVRRGTCYVVNQLPVSPGGEGATRSSVFAAQIRALR